MEFVEGRPLSVVVAGGPLSAPKVIRLAKEVCAGLAEAHSKGIVHRDLKSENIILARDGKAKILDFGLAKQLAEPDPGLSVVGAVVGTYRSMSPEQAQGHQVDHRTDLFSFGILLYEAATGKSPFQGPSALATLAKLVTQKQVPARSLEPEIGEELSGLIDWLLEKAAGKPPADRRRGGPRARALRRRLSPSFDLHLQDLLLVLGDPAAGHPLGRRHQGFQPLRLELDPHHGHRHSTLYRGFTFREPQRRRRKRVFQRWPDRRSDPRPLADPRSQGGFPHIGLLVQG